jgi:hypothetical protein
MFVIWVNTKFATWRLNHEDRRHGLQNKQSNSGLESDLDRGGARAKGGLKMAEENRLKRRGNFQSAVFTLHGDCFENVRLRSLKRLSDPLAAVRFCLFPLHALG